MAATPLRAIVLKYKDSSKVRVVLCFPYDTSTSCSLASNDHKSTGHNIIKISIYPAHNRYDKNKNNTLQSPLVLHPKPLVNVIGLLNCLYPEVDILSTISECTAKWVYLIFTFISGSLKKYSVSANTFLSDVKAFIMSGYKITTLV